MVSFLTFLAVLATVLLQVLAIPAPIGRGLSHETELRATHWGEMLWTGPVTPGGPDVTLRGDVLKIKEQIFALNPKFDPLDFEVDPVAKRHTLNRIRPVLCNPGGNQADYEGIVLGYGHLMSLHGTCSVGAGPKECTRLYCDGKGAAVITLCNDGKEMITPSCSYLGTYVADILNSCPSVDGKYVMGQAFDTDGYNVLVNAAANNKC